VVLPDDDQRQRAAPSSRRCCSRSSMPPCPAGFGPFFELKFYGRERRLVADAAEDGCGFSGLRFTLGRRMGVRLVDSTGGVTRTLSLLWRLGVVPVCGGSSMSGTASELYADSHSEIAAITIREASANVCAIDAIAHAQLSSATGVLPTPINTSGAGLTAIAPDDPALVLLNWHRTGDDCSATAASQLDLTFRGERTPVTVTLGSLAPPVIPCGPTVQITGPEPASVLPSRG
jgi:hypothetical protein